MEQQSVLEKAVDDASSVLPYELPRFRILMRGLDEAAVLKSTELAKKYAAFVDEATNACAEAGSSAEKEKIIAKLRKSPLFEEILVLKRDVESLNEEKKTIVEQLQGMIRSFVDRAKFSAKELEDLLRGRGAIIAESSIDADGTSRPGSALADPINISTKDLGEGQILAACTTEGESANSPTGRTNGQWILATLLTYSGANHVVVSDADNPSVRYTLLHDAVVPLPEQGPEDARARLPNRGGAVLAMYPETTSFYKGTIVSAPFLYKGSDPAYAGRTMVFVQFDDDEDATGALPKRELPASRVF